MDGGTGIVDDRFRHRSHLGQDIYAAGGVALNHHATLGAYRSTTVTTQTPKERPRRSPSCMISELQRTPVPICRARPTRPPLRAHRHRPRTRWTHRDRAHGVRRGARHRSRARQDSDRGHRPRCGSPNQGLGRPDPGPRSSLTVATPSGAPHPRRRGRMQPLRDHRQSANSREPRRSTRPARIKLPISTQVGLVFERVFE